MQIEHRRGCSKSTTSLSILDHAIVVEFFFLLSCCSSMLLFGNLDLKIWQNDEGNGKCPRAIAFEFLLCGN